jgi:hypothetical protein
MKPYQAPHGVSIPTSELFMVLLTVVLGGTIIGIVAYIISTMFWVIILFPAVMGLVGGVLLKWQIKGAKLGSPAYAVLVGLFAGLMIFSIYFVSDYFYFRHVTTQELAADAAYYGLPSSELLDELLRFETGSGGYLGFLKLNMREGIWISRVGIPMDSGFVITGAWVFVYHLIEAALVIGITAKMAFDAGKQPFCAKCRDWIDQNVHLGFVPHKQSLGYQETLRIGNINAVGSLLQEDAPPKKPYLEVLVGRCEQSASCEGVLTLRQASRGRYGSTHYKVLDRYTVTPREVDYLVNATRSPLDWEPSAASKLDGINRDTSQTKGASEDTGASKHPWENR